MPTIVKVWFALAALCFLIGVYQLGKMAGWDEAADTYISIQRKYLESK